MNVAVVRHDPGDPFRKTLLDLGVCEKLTNRIKLILKKIQGDKTLLYKKNSFCRNFLLIGT